MRNWTDAVDIGNTNARQISDGTALYTFINQEYTVGATDVIVGLEITAAGGSGSSTAGGWFEITELLDTQTVPA